MEKEIIKNKEQLSEELKEMLAVFDECKKNGTLVDDEVFKDYVKKLSAHFDPEDVKRLWEEAKNQVARDIL